MQNVNIADQIMSIINQIAEKLGVAAEKVYPILRKQAIVEGIIYLVWVLFSLIILTITTILIVKYLKEQKKEYWEIDEGDIMGCFMLGIVPCCVGIIMFAENIKLMLTAFANPDWYIFNECY